MHLITESEKEPDIYNSDPEKDKNINAELKSFLNTICFKQSRIIMKNNFSVLTTITKTGSEPIT